MAVYFDAVGTIHPIKETEKFKAVEYHRFDSGWAKKVLRFNFRTNTGSVTNMEISALYRANEDGTPADDNKTYDRKEGWIEYPERKEYSGKGRFMTSFLDKSPYKVANVLKAYDEGNLSTYDADKYGIHSDEDYEELSKKYNTCVKYFLFDIDFINYFERILENYDKFLKGRLMRVSGEWTFEYSAQKDAIYKKFVPNRIEYCHDEDPVQVIALKVPFIFKGKNPIAVGKGDKKVLKGYTNYFAREFKTEEFKGKYLAPIEIVIPENLEKSISNRFDKEDPTVTSDYKLWNLNCAYINGAEKKDIEEDDLSPDEKFDIECGFRTLEEIRAEHAKADKGADEKGKYDSTKVYGDRITEIRLIKCGEKGNPENAEYDDRQTESPSHDMPEEVKQAVGATSDDDDIFEI